MKKLVLFLLVAGGLGSGVYFHLYGRLPWQPPSADEQQVEALREAFGQARQHWQAAGHTAAFGIDASSLADPAIAELERIQAGLDEVAPQLSSRPARIKAEQLRRDLASFKASMR
jgi:hypothetical protein